MLENNFLSAIKIWAAMAWADGVISAEEALAMKAIIQVGKLSDDDRATALSWLDAKVELDTAGLDEMSDEDKRTLYLSAAQVAAIDNDVADAEKAFLARLRTALAIDDATAKEVHDAIPHLAG
jgi:uncharacterized membrane protein YebE (DUF533 family)